MYVFDTNVFITLGMYYPRRFPTLWDKLHILAESGEIQSVREVFRELDKNCSSADVATWISVHKKIFEVPSEEEMRLVSSILMKPQYQSFVRRDSILKGLPVADPFIIAAAIHKKACVVTQESEKKKGGARIPDACTVYDVKCINLEGFLEEQGIQY